MGIGLSQAVERRFVLGGHVVGVRADDARSQEPHHVVERVARLQQVRCCRGHRSSGVECQHQRHRKQRAAADVWCLAVDDRHRGLHQVHAFRQIARSEGEGIKVVVAAGHHVGKAHRDTVDEHLDGRSRHVAGARRRGGQRWNARGDEFSQICLDRNRSQVFGSDVVAVRGARVASGVEDHGIGQRRGEVLDLQVVRVRQ